MKYDYTPVPLKSRKTTAITVLVIFIVGVLAVSLTAFAYVIREVQHALNPAIAPEMRTYEDDSI